MTELPTEMFRIYVAGPLSTVQQGQDAYTSVCLNIRQAVEAGDKLIEAGFAPFVPHLSHYQNLYNAHSWDVWMAIDYAWVSASDAILRLPGESKGANVEVEWAEALGIPVFYSVVEVVNYFNGLSAPPIVRSNRALYDEETDGDTTWGPDSDFLYDSGEAAQ